MPPPPLPAANRIERKRAAGIWYAKPDGSIQAVDRFHIHQVDRNVRAPDRLDDRDMFRIKLCVARIGTGVHVPRILIDGASESPAGLAAGTGLALPLMISIPFLSVFAARRTRD